MSWPDNECGPDDQLKSDAPMAGCDRVLEEVFEERCRQERKWGQQNHDLPRYFAIMSEEVGEVAKAIVEHEWPGNEQSRGLLLLDVRKELIQAAAVAVAMVERIDRQIDAGEAER